MAPFRTTIGTTPEFQYSQIYNLVSSTKSSIHHNVIAQYFFNNYLHNRKTTRAISILQVATKSVELYSVFSLSYRLINTNHWQQVKYNFSFTSFNKNEQKIDWHSKFNLPGLFGRLKSQGKYRL